jgi:hypothetical protein
MHNTSLTEKTQAELLSFVSAPVVLSWGEAKRASSPCCELLQLFSLLLKVNLSQILCFIYLLRTKRDKTTTPDHKTDYENYTVRPIYLKQNGLRN